MNGFIFGYLLGRGAQHIDPNNGLLFCFAAGTAMLIMLICMFIVVIGNRLGYKWAQQFYPNIFLPDWKKK